MVTSLTMKLEVLEFNWNGIKLPVIARGVSGSSTLECNLSSEVVLNTHD